MKMHHSLHAITFFVICLGNVQSFEANFESEIVRGDAKFCHYMNGDLIIVPSFEKCPKISNTMKGVA